MAKQESNKRLKVLVLDAQNQNTLAIVRHLGKNHEIHVAGASAFCLSFFSKYAAKKVRLPDPKREPDAFLGQLTAVLISGKYDLLMPVGFRSYQLCAAHQAELKKYTQLIVTSSDNITLASDKQATYALAEQLGIPYPKTYDIRGGADFDNYTFRFPLVIKYPYESGKNVVDYAFNTNEAKMKFTAMKNASPGKAVVPLVQEYVAGEGYGFFAYYAAGVCKAYFMHHRIREYPVTGGASVCAESYADDALKSSGKKILDALQWNGVAMVEYKKDQYDGKYKLMEINPKFWGSLELAITAGIDFPGMLCEQAAGREVSSENHFEKVTFQWLLNGELFHFLSRPSSFFAILQTISNSKTDFRWNDILPNLFQVLNIFVHYYKKLTGR